MSNDIHNPDDVENGLDDSGLEEQQHERHESLLGLEVLESVVDGRNRGMPGSQTAVTPELLRQIVEGAILAAGQPMTIVRLRELFDEEFAPTKEDIQAALEQIQADSEGRGFELKEVASGWRFQVRENLAPWVNRLWEEKPQKYSRALLETLALIAYRQPITRGDIEEIRGVAVSSHIMKTLLERDWVKVVGHRDVPGRPSLYATTRQFLDYFNLKSLDELPSLSEIRDLDDLNPMLNLGGEEGLGEKDTDAPIPDSAQPELASLDERQEDMQETEVIALEDGFSDQQDAYEDTEVTPDAEINDFVSAKTEDNLPANEDADKT
ncbi:SMC-Scp complex subunit ScpB [Cellvibrio japonicus]|uniref:SMC-Scp complex subunit ScpB n=1 Tax=Cellvibrio japonicus TaxID=155077 RepID=UPI0002E197F3|nr:SMC-Scp complex subunit ScpB [Cellvibrio japonicus]